MSKTIKTVAAVAAVVAAGAVFADSTPGRGCGDGQRGPGGQAGQRGAMMFERLDADRDGAVSKAEFETMQQQRMQASQQRRMQMFDQADADKDGKLSQEEMTAYRHAMRAQMSARMAEHGQRDAGRHGAHRHTDGMRRYQGNPGTQGTQPAPQAQPQTETGA